MIPADLFRDDFSRFPPGWLTRPVGQLNGAIQEYHYLPHRGVPLGPWANAICHLDAWAVGEEEGKPYLEQHTVNDQSATDEPDLLDRRPRVGGLHASRSACGRSPSTIWPASSSAITPIGITTCSRSTDGKTRPPGAAPAARKDVPRGGLARARHRPLSVRHHAVLPPAVENEGRKIRAFIDGKLILDGRRRRAPPEGRPASPPTSRRGSRTSASRARR